MLQRAIGEVLNGMSTLFNLRSRLLKDCGFRSSTICGLALIVLGVEKLCSAVGLLGKSAIEGGSTGRSLKSVTVVEVPLPGSPSPCEESFGGTGGVSASSKFRISSFNFGMEGVAVSFVLLLESVCFELRRLFFLSGAGLSIASFGGVLEGMKGLDDLGDCSALTRGGGSGCSVSERSEICSGGASLRLAVSDLCCSSSFAATRRCNAGLLTLTCSDLT